MEAEQIPTVDDLAPWMKRRFEEAYTDAGIRRPRCSREDFAAGYLAALLGMRVAAAFTEDAQTLLNLKPRA
jgi:hypothetical protein